MPSPCPGSTTAPTSSSSTGAGPSPAQPRVDRLQPQRPGRDDPGGLRLPHRDAALPQQPDPRAQPAQVPPAPGGAAAARERCARRRAGDQRPRPAAGRDAPGRRRAARRRGPLPHHARLDVLPVEARAYYKRLLADVPDDVQGYYDRLYAAERAPGSGARVRAYETVPFAHRGLDRVDLASAHGTSLWVALLARESDAGPPRVRPGQPQGRTLSFGLVPVVPDEGVTLRPAEGGDGAARWEFRLPRVELQGDGERAIAARPRGSREYQLDATPVGDVWREPGVVDVQLPADANRLRFWEDLEASSRASATSRPTSRTPPCARGSSRGSRSRPSAPRSRASRGWALTPSPSSSASGWTTSRCPTAPASPTRRPPSRTARCSPTRCASRSTASPGAPSTTFEAGAEIAVADPRRPPGPSRSAGTRRTRTPTRSTRRPGACASATTLRGRRPPGAALRASYAVRGARGQRRRGRDRQGRRAPRAPGVEPRGRLGRRRRRGRGRRRAPHREAPAPPRPPRHRGGLRGDRARHARRRPRPRRRAARVPPTSARGEPATRRRGDPAGGAALRPAHPDAPGPTPPRSTRWPAGSRRAAW